MIVTHNDRRTIQRLVREAKYKIKEETGLTVKINTEVKTRILPDDVYSLLGIIASALNMTMDDYMEGRNREYVDLRSIAILFIRQLYPKVSVMDIGSLFGGMDHSSVVYNHSRAHNLMQTKESVFMEKYNTASKAVNKWIQE